MHVRKGDTVVVIAGNDKGKRGTIRSVIRDANRVIVEGINLRWKHRKANQKNPKGERVQRAAPSTRSQRTRSPKAPTASRRA